MRIKLRDLTKWHTWFAWHPVVVDDTIVWLEDVIRKQGSGYEATYEYREKWPK